MRLSNLRCASEVIADLCKVIFDFFNVNSDPSDRSHWNSLFSRSHVLVATADLFNVRRQCAKLILPAQRGGAGRPSSPLDSSTYNVSAQIAPGARRTRSPQGQTNPHRAARLSSNATDTACLPIFIINDLLTVAYGTDLHDSRNSTLIQRAYILQAYIAVMIGCNEGSQYTSIYYSEWTLHLDDCRRAVSGNAPQPASVPFVHLPASLGSQSPSGQARLGFNYALNSKAPSSPSNERIRV